MKFINHLFMSSAQCKQSVQVLLSVCSKKDCVVMSLLSATREAEAGRMELVDSKSDLARLCLQIKEKSSVVRLLAYNS